MAIDLYKEDLDQENTKKQLNSQVNNTVSGVEAGHRKLLTIDVTAAGQELVTDALKTDGFSLLGTIANDLDGTSIFGKATTTILDALVTAGHPSEGDTAYDETLDKMVLSDGTQFNPVLSENSLGRVGIGVVPERTFHVRSQAGGVISRLDGIAGTTMMLSTFSASFTSVNKTFGILITDSGADNGTFAIADFHQGTGGSSDTRFLIDNAGNVGIGVDEPDRALHVNGGGFQVGAKNDVVGNRLVVDSSGNVEHTFGLNDGSPTTNRGRFKLLNNSGATVQASNDSGALLLRGNAGRWGAVSGSNAQGELRFHVGGLSTDQAYDNLSVTEAMRIGQFGAVSMFFDLQLDADTIHQNVTPAGSNSEIWLDNTNLIERMRLQFTDTGGGTMLFTGNAQLLFANTDGAQWDFTMTGGDDTTPFFEWNQQGTDGADIDIHITGRDPSNFSMTPGSLAIRGEGEDSALYINATSIGGSTHRRIATTGPIIKEVYRQEDLGTPSAGTITIESGSYEIRQGFLLTNSLVVAVGASVRITGHSGNTLITYVIPSGTWITSVRAAEIVLEDLVVIHAAASQTIFDMGSDDQTGVINISRCNFVGVSTGLNVGTLAGHRAMLINNSAFVGYESGMTLSGTRVIRMEVLGFISSGVGTGDALTVSDRSDAVSLNAVGFTLNNPSETAFSISPSTQSLEAENIEMLGLSTNVYNVSGSTGTFTVVADDSTTAFTISSVTDSSGTARFNFTPGPTLFVEQGIINANFVTNTTYNVSGFITAVGLGFYEIAGVDFVADETGGDFSTQTVTLTDTGTTVSEGEAITVSGDVNVDYDDDGKNAYNVLTNSFQIDGTFTSTTTGSWSTEGLNQTSKFVNADDVNGERDSKDIGSTVTTANAVATVIATIDTFTDLNLGTLALPATNIELWKLVNTTTGELLEAGLTTFSGTLVAQISAFSSGGAQEFQFRAVKNGSVLPDIVVSAASLGSNLGNIAITVPIEAEPGDTIRLQVQNVDGTTDITIQELSLTIR